MAPFKICSSSMELLEPEVTKPSPLRIIKRSKTVTANSSSREAFRGRGQRSSCSSLQSRGSPPLGADRPLTVRKKRQGENVVDMRSEGRSLDKENEEPFAPTSGANDEDPDITPKARQRVSRTISAGNFLKSEFYRRGLEEQGRYSVRNNRTSFHPPQFTSPISTPPCSTKDNSYQLPERKTSKSKSFILRALAGRSSRDSNHEQRMNSKGSRNTLIRRLSRNKTMDPFQSRRTSMSGDTLYSIHLEDLNFGSTDGNVSAPRSQTPVRAHLQEPTPAPAEASRQDMLVLSPRIKVTSQTNSLPTTTCTIWVAIEVKGELHAADGRYDMHPSRRRCSSELLDIQLQDLSRYGSLFDMRIIIQPPRGCALLDYIGDLKFKLNALETRFILAKIRVDGVDCNPSPSTRDPEILMAELQNHLGETLTHYLTVQAIYKHSGFTEWEGSNATREGTYAHSSFHQTEARVAIKRHDPLSAWSPRSSETFNIPPQSTVFTELIERHLPADKAARALSIIYKDEPHTPSNVQRVVSSGARQELRGSSQAGRSAFRNASVTSTRPQTPSSRAKSQTTGGPVATSPPTPARRTQPGEEEDEENDPARKIWASMREVSRGGRPRHHPRKSISADHYNIVGDGASPDRLSSSHSLTNSPHYQSSESFDDSGIELERSKIKQVALKNKRSVGTETLRSMAPSVGRTGKGNQTTTGLGIRTGVWGWANFW